MGHCRKTCISLFMTTECNLSCNYCYLRNYKLQPESIDVEFAAVGIRDYFTDTSSRHIRFYGAGEPTLELRKLKAICKIAQGIAGCAVVVEVQTNGIFGTETARWLAN